MIKFFIILILFSISLKSYAESNNQDLTEKINQCNAIPKNEIKYVGIGYWGSGPSYYARSKCFYELAIDERAPRLCSRVKKLNSPYYTKENCRLKTAEKIAKDKAYAAQFNSVHHEIDEAFFRKNGNGKDFDFIIQVSGDKRICYKMEWTIGSLVLYSDFRTFGEGTTRLNLYFPRQDLLEKLNGMPIDRNYEVKIYLSKDIGRHATKYLAKENISIEKYIDVNFSELTWKPK